jgi:hypothetical protein
MISPAELDDVAGPLPSAKVRKTTLSDDRQHQDANSTGSAFVAAFGALRLSEKCQSSSPFSPTQDLPKSLKAQGKHILQAIRNESGVANSVG